MSGRRRWVVLGLAIQLSASIAAGKPGRRYLDLRVGMAGLVGKPEYGSGPLLSLSGQFQLTSSAPGSGAGLSINGNLDIDLVGTASPPCTRCPEPGGTTRRFYLLRGDVSYGWLVKEHELIARVGCELAHLPAPQLINGPIDSLFLSLGFRALLKLLPKLFLALSIDAFPVGTNNNPVYGHKWGVAAGMEVFGRLGHLLLGVRYRTLYLGAAGTTQFGGISEMLHLGGAFVGFSYR